ncbi:MAG TPA: RNA methyltransferase [Acidobacteriaceae bacterium]|nr:RNA methyltransferase [Acidobacteriaceae bacterium]
MTPLDHLRVVLVSTRNPLNIGAAARAMSNFGFTRLRVVAPYDTAFREARSAVGAPELLRNAEEFSTIADSVSDCSLVIGTTAVRTRELLHPLKRLEEGSPLIREHLQTGKAALLFGSEKRGLSNNDLSHCHWLMRIPTADANISMNLGQAVAVCLYELIRANPPAEGAPAPVSATAESLERMTAALFEGIAASGYVKRGSEAASLEKARRLVRRMALNPEDAETWTGAFAKMALALQRNRRNNEGG